MSVVDSGPWGPALRAVGLTLVVGGAGAAIALEVPYLTARVNDNAGMLSAPATERIETMLATFEESTGSQVAILTISTLDGEALEDFSLRVAETWGLGRRGADDGVLFLVVRDDRKMRIEVGYGLEADLTDAESGRILRNVVRPHFQRGDFDGGIEAGAEAIIGALEGVEVPGGEPGSGGSEPFLAKLGIFGFFLAIMSVFAVNALFSKGFGSWFLYVFLMPFMATFPGAIFGPRAAVVMLGLWIVGFPLLKLLIRRTPAGRRWVDRHPTWTSWSSGGASGGGGFSGGGGSFGGGGASSSW